MIETIIKKVQIVNTLSPTVAVATNQETKLVERGVSDFSKDEQKELITLKRVKNTQNLIKLSGITTSQVEQALKGKSPYPARVFLKVGAQTKDIPIFFRIKEKQCQVNCPIKEIKHQVAEVWIKPQIKKGSALQVTGHWAINHSASEHRLMPKSLLVSSYQLLTKKKITNLITNA